MYRLVLLIFPLCCAVSGLWAQEGLGVHFMRGTWAAYGTNPALPVEGEVNVMLPQLYGDYYWSDLDLATVVGEDTEGSPLLDAQAILRQLQDENALRENQHLGTFGLGLRFDRWWVSLAHSWREQGAGWYPQTLARLIWEGNANYLDETLDISTELDLAQYHQWSAGLGYQLTGALSLGLRLHALSGVYHVGVERPELQVRTDSEDTELSLDADFLLHSAGGFRYEGFDSIRVGYDPLRLHSGLMGPNWGMALDLGADYVDGPWQASLSVLGLGSIRWREDTRNYRIEGQKTFVGIDVLDSLFAGATTLPSVLDSLSGALGVVETQETYRRSSPTRLFASLGYQLNPRWRLGALFVQEWRAGRSWPSAALSANYRARPWLELGALYAYRASSFDNIGLNANLRAGAFQLVLATDSLLGLINWQQASSGNFRLGFNLVFPARSRAVAGERPAE